MRRSAAESQSPAGSGSWIGRSPMAHAPTPLRCDPVAIDLASLWNFADPQASARAFAAAIATAEGDDRLVLATQLARTHGLRGDFAETSRLLDQLEPLAEKAGPVARAHLALERGRSLVSPAHPADSIDATARAAARSSYLKARDLALEGCDDALAIDAIHMLAFVETDPPAQLRWNRQALELALASTQPSARRWEASLRNNIGCALHESGRFEEALAEFTRALELRVAARDEERTRVARWMIAWTLRSLGRLEEALEIQLDLEMACREAGAMDRFVLDELIEICRELGDSDRETEYRRRRDEAG